MKASRGDSTLSIDASEDTSLRNAAAANIWFETICSLIMICIVLDQIYGDELTQKIVKFVKKWRRQLFGNPKPSEEDIQRLAKNLFIEATRVVRGAT